MFPEERILFDLKGWLFEELILKKGFQEQMKFIPGKNTRMLLVAVVTCTADAIIFRLGLYAHCNKTFTLCQEDCIWESDHTGRRTFS